MCSANFRFVPVRENRSEEQKIAVLVSGCRIIVARAFDPRSEDAVTFCDELNRRLGLDQRTAA